MWMKSRHCVTSLLCLFALQSSSHDASRKEAQTDTGWRMEEGKANNEHWSMTQAIWEHWSSCSREVVVVYHLYLSHNHISTADTHHKRVDNGQPADSNPPRHHHLTFSQQYLAELLGVAFPEKKEHNKEAFPRIQPTFTTRKNVYLKPFQTFVNDDYFKRGGVYLMPPGKCLSSEKKAESLLSRNFSSDGQSQKSKPAGSEWWKRPRCPRHHDGKQAKSQQTHRINWVSIGTEFPGLLLCSMTAKTSQMVRTL